MGVTGSRRSFTAWALLALILGLGLGFLLQGPQDPWVEQASNVLRGVRRVWMLAFQYTIVPLVVSQALLAVLSTEKLGFLGLKTVVVFVGLLVGAAVLTLLVAPLLLTLFSPQSRHGRGVAKRDPRPRSPPDLPGAGNHDRQHAPGLSPHRDRSAAPGQWPAPSPGDYPHAWRAREAVARPHP